MARTALPIISPLGSYPALPLGAGSAAFVFTAPDAVNFNSFVATGRELLLVNNTGTTATITVHSVVDPSNRTGDITTYSVAGSTFAVLGPFKLPGWQQADGTIWVDCSAVGVTLAVVRLPSLP